LEEEEERERKEGIIKKTERKQNSLEHLHPIEKK
jgi:hypothetical protein